VRDGKSDGSDYSAPNNSTCPLSRLVAVHATVFHLLGLDHLELTFKFQGRHFRLTDVAGEVIDKLIA
jgi:hypothetical protein